jgi:hypothetical protein
MIQWSHFNAYLPAMVFLAFAGAAALPALAGAVRALAPKRSAGADLFVGAGALMIALNLAFTSWRPSHFVPTAADRAAGAALVARLASVPGEVFVPSHPWYAVLAGKRPFVHRMGVMETMYRPRVAGRVNRLPARAQEVVGLGEALSRGLFDLIVLDDRWSEHEFPALATSYRLQEVLADRDSPRVVSGRPTRPRGVYVPAARAPVPGARPPGGLPGGGPPPG